MYEFEIGPALGMFLKRRPDGACVHLGDHGCTVHDYAPVDCREFDCRVTYRDYMSLPRPLRRRVQRDFDRLHLWSKDIREAAKARIHTL